MLALESTADLLPGPSDDSTHSNKLKSPVPQGVTKGHCLSALQLQEAWLHHRKQMLVENQQHLENLIGHTAVNPDGVEEYQTGSNRGNDCYLGLKNPDEVPQIFGRSTNLGEAGMERFRRDQHAFSTKWTPT